MLVQTTVCRYFKYLHAIYALLDLMMILKTQHQLTLIPKPLCDLMLIFKTFHHLTLIFIILVYLLLS